MYDSRDSVHRYQIFKKEKKLSPYTGYGLEIEKTFSRPEPDLKDVTSHFRVIRYRLGDLECVVQFQADAHLQTNENPHASAAEKTDSSSHPRSDADFNVEDQTNWRPLQVIPGGRVVPLSTLVEIKSYLDQNQDLALKETIAHTWFSRIPNSIFVRLDKGKVTSVKHLRIANDFSSWETEHQEGLRKLTSLITQLRGVASQAKGKVFKARFNGPKLEIYESKDSNLIPPEKFITQFWR